MRVLGFIWSPIKISSNSFLKPTYFNFLIRKSIKDKIYYTNWTLCKPTRKLPAVIACSNELKKHGLMNKFKGDYSIQRSWWMYQLKNRSLILKIKCLIGYFLMKMKEATGINTSRFPKRPAAVIVVHQFDD